MPSVDDIVHRYFNTYLQVNDLRTADIDINTAIFEVLGDAGYTGPLVERAQQAADALSVSPGGFYHIVYQIASTGLLEANPAYLQSDLLAWYDPTDITTLFQDSAGTTPVASDADPVGMMQDKSSHLRHVTQATADSRPLYVAANGSLSYDGTADCMTLESQPFPSGASPSEIWAIVKQNALPADTTQRQPVGYGGTLSQALRRFQRFVDTGVNRFRTSTGDGASATTATVASVDFSGVHRLRGSFGATATVAYIDGVSQSAAVVPSTGTTRLRIGAGTAAAPANFWNGEIGPVIITLPLTDLKSAWMETYYNSINMT